MCFSKQIGAVGTFVNIDMIQIIAMAYDALGRLQNDKLQAIEEFTQVCGKAHGNFEWKIILKM